MLSENLVDYSRLQFAVTALYHFLFVPLTLGLSVLIAVMETVYVMTGRAIWKDMVKFWGILFGINFAMGVATGITLEFQFGTNWSYYSHYVGDIFGAPLAIEGLMAFFLEATFVGLFYFGWDRLSKVGHWVVTCLLALATNFSALWILIANGWMQNPVGARFNFQTMRMEVDNFYAVIFNPVAQAKFVHTVSAGYVTGALFVLSVSAYYLLKGRNVALAQRSMTVAVSFGLASALSVVVLGDESGYVANENQQMKLAAIEGIWETEEAPAALNLFGIPDQARHETHYTVQIPYLLGLIATRSFSQPVLGVEDLLKENEKRIRRGVEAYLALAHLKEHPGDLALRHNFESKAEDLGYGLLLKRYHPDWENVSPELIKKAALSTLPQVAPLFWSFRVMVVLGLYFIALFAVGFYLSCKRHLTCPLFLKFAFFSLPLPWVAGELGWIVSEYGRQPWVIQGILPTYLGVSSLPEAHVLASLVGFIVLYSVLFGLEMYLMFKYVRLGPEGTVHSGLKG